MRVMVIKAETYSEANDDTDKLFKSLHSIYQDGLETSVKGIDSNQDDKCFQYAKTVALSYEDIK